MFTRETMKLYSADITEITAKRHMHISLFKIYVMLSEMKNGHLKKDTVSLI